MVNMYGDRMFWYEVLGPADKFGESEGIGFIDDYTKPAATLQLREAIRRGRFPKGSSLYRDITTDANAAKAGNTVSHYDVFIKY
ncbi:hypothetical protein AGMMS50268_37090 [Spirochaetia bacterium]|nr:hypothetical protein AGMMS50268_37090 [Spirochaetia bacterium]